MFNLKFNVINGPQFNRALSGFADAVSDIRPYADDIINGGIRPNIAEQYASRGAAGEHGAWEELTPDYLEAKLKKWGEMQIEIASSRTYNSLMQDTDDTVKQVTQKAIQFGTSVPYAIFQQTGFATRLGTGKGKPKPDGKAYVAPRRLFDWTVPQQDSIMKAFQRSLMASLTRLGYKILGRGVSP